MLDVTLMFVLIGFGVAFVLAEDTIVADADSFIVSNAILVSVNIHVASSSMAYRCCSVSSLVINGVTGSTRSDVMLAPGK